MLPPNTILQNRYRVIRHLGRGGMGAVYEAIDQRLSSVVALKETLVETEELRRAFEREAALLANLRHPSLPKVIDHFTEGDGQYLVMEFIPGNDLAQLLELRGRPFDPAEVLRWADELLSALKYLHTRTPPIIHRDIKPANLKMTAEGEIILLDFGLAKGSAGQMTSRDASRSVVGYTPVYASLEQIMGAGTDVRSDLYSLAATIYHLITNALPLDAPTRFAAIEDDQPDPLKRVHELNPAVPEAVSDVLYQAMAIRRKDRQASAEEMRQSLREASRAITTDPREATTIVMPPTIFSHPSEEKILTREGERKSADELSPTRMAEARAGETQAASTISSTTQAAQQTSEQERAVSSVERTKLPATISANQELPEKFPHPSYSQPHTRPRDFLPVIIGAIVLVLIAGVAALLMFTRSVGDNTNSSQTSTERERNNAQINTNHTSGAPGIRAPEGMVYVPGGTFKMGRDNGDEYERPAHQVTVKPFFIDIYEVTNEDYQKFVQATGHRPPSTWTNGAKRTYPAELARKPVTGVNWEDANDYAKWAGKRLPTEEEWEFAARGTDERLYPWGNSWQAGMANAGGASMSLADVGSYRGASPFGAYDMVGNAWEWTASKMIPYPGGTLPIKVSDEFKVIRGGTYESNRNQATTTYRRGWSATNASDYSYTGFRLARDVER